MIECHCGHRCIGLAAIPAVVQKEEDYGRLFGRLMRGLYGNMVSESDL
jgi:hypothetical protein